MTGEGKTAGSCTVALVIFKWSGSPSFLPHFMGREHFSERSGGILALGLDPAAARHDGQRLENERRTTKHP